MTRALGSWEQLSDSAKYRMYTRLTLESSVAAIVVFAAFAAHSYPVVIVALLVAGVAAIAEFESRPELTGRVPRPVDRWLRVGAAACFVGAWLAGPMIRNQIGDESTLSTASFVVSLAAISSIAFARRRWLILVAVVVVTALTFTTDNPVGLRIAVLGVITAFFVGVTRLSLWTLTIVDDLDAARETKARLDVAEERLRFARDLHDVVGRGFSTIAVKSELASRLSRAGAAEQAAGEMDEVNALAVSSLEEMRSLVRGYRGIDLAGEVAGARSLLGSAGCLLTVEGDSSAVPPECHEAAAWVVREGTTNIVRHSSATAATLTLGESGMSLTNDGAPAAVGPRSGIAGLAERLDAIGATVRTQSSDGVFTLEIRWEKA